jgi:hypothetical protein
MNKIMSCNKCGVIFNIIDWRWSFAAFGFTELGEVELKDKENIYWNWLDLEQTAEGYYKFCLICNSWEYHNEVVLNG